MKNPLRGMALAALAVLVLALVPARAARTVRVGVCRNCPLIMATQEREPGGLFLDIIAEIAKREGWRLKFVEAVWAQGMANLAAGTIDILPGIAITPARKKLFKFSRESIISTWGQVYSRGDGNIRTILDLHQKPIAILARDIYGTDLMRLAEKFDVKPVWIKCGSYVEAFTKVEQGRAVAAGMERFCAKMLLSRFKLQGTPIIYGRHDLHFGFPKTAPDSFIAAVDRQLAAMKADKTSAYHLALAQWITRPDGKETPRWVYWLMAWVAGTMLAVLLLAWLLRRQVRRKTRELEKANLEMLEVINNQQLAEKALRESEEKYRAIFENALEGLFQTTPDGVYLSANPALARILGYESPEELMSMVADTRELYLDPEDRERLLARLRKDGSVSGFEARMSRKDGQPVWVSLEATGYFDPDGGMTRLEGIVLDISARRKAETERASLENQLAQAQKMEAVGNLAGGIAHDFNNLLQTISGNVQLLLMKSEASGRSRQKLHDINNTVERAKALVTRLLTLGRKAKVKAAPLDLNEVINGALQLLERTIPKMVNIKTRLDPELSVIQADPTQIEQVLVNLVNNAVDAMEGAGELLLETENFSVKTKEEEKYLDLPEGEYVLLKVSDTGCGMDAETQERIFEPFYTTKGIGRGTGLGLSTVYGIVKNHQGRISCYSEPGQGAVFKIFLPRAQGAALQPAKARAQRKETPGGDETVLCVDDEEKILDVAQQVLAGHGYQVLRASTGEEALEILSSRPHEVDLVLMDLGMPGMGGVKCLEEIKAMAPSLRVIVASGYSHGENVRRVLANGAAGFLPKPYDLWDLLKTVRLVLDE